MIFTTTDDDKRKGLINVKGRQAMKTPLKRKKAEIDVPRKLTAKELKHHRNLPFEDVEHRDSTAIRLIDLALILENLHPYKNDQTILDVGAGGGWTSEWFSRAGLNVISVDISPHWAGIFRDRCPETPYIVCDAENLPFRDSSFDFVSIYDALHHMPNREKVVREFYKVLKRGGRAVFLEPGSKHAESMQTHREMKRFGTVEEDVNPFELKKLCKKAGFKRVYIRPTYMSLKPNSAESSRGWMRDAILSPFRVVVSVMGRAFVVAIK